MIRMIRYDMPRVVAMKPNLALTSPPPSSHLAKKKKARAPPSKPYHDHEERGTGARTDGNPIVVPSFTRKRTTVTERNRTANVGRMISKVLKTVDDKSEIGLVEQGNAI